MKQEVKGRMFTDKQILEVIKNLQENPLLIPQMIGAAAGGDHDDIQFLLEAAMLGYSLWSDNPMTGEVHFTPKEKPKTPAVI